MKLYHLYVSGILYGKLNFDTQPVSISKLDFASGTLGSWEPLSESDNQFYKNFAKIDFLKLSRQISQYESLLSGTGEISASLPDGDERYTSEDGSWYLQRDIKFPNNKLMENGRLLAVCCSAREMISLLVLERQH